MNNSVIQGDVLEVCRSLPDNSINLLVNDVPYHRVKAEVWDRQWKTDKDYLSWLDSVLAAFHRVLKPNGSLYLFASPRMAARVEVLVSERFNVIQRITWRKPDFGTKAEMFRKGDLRSFFPVSEAIIFAEHYGADNVAKGEAGYAAKCDELRGFVFEPLRAYLDSERLKARLNYRQCNEIIGLPVKGGGMATHYFSDPVKLGHPQWALPTAEHYAKLQGATGFFHREYEDLRREYEDLRRPFNATPQRPYTDVWTFPTVKPYPGKHPCEKPLEMLEHIILTSSRPGDVVADFFAGSGTTPLAALKHGRQYIASDISVHWCEFAEKRLARELEQPRLLEAAD